jgi:hypothetical protein
MGGAEFVCFARIEGGMDPSEHDEGASVSCEPPNFESAQCVGGMDADSDDVSWLQVTGTKGFQCLIDNDRVAVVRGGCSSKHVQPTGCYDCHTKGYVTRVH